MENEDLVRYWTQTAEDDFISMKRVLGARAYTWTVFIGHLVIEKLLKACCARRWGARVPKTHNLSLLAEKAGISLSPERRAQLDRLTALQGATRYPDQRGAFRGRAGKAAAQKCVKEVVEIRKWLRGILSG